MLFNSYKNKFEISNLQPPHVLVTLVMGKAIMIETPVGDTHVVIPPNIVGLMVHVLTPVRSVTTNVMDINLQQPLKTKWVEVRIFVDHV